MNAVLVPPVVWLAAHPAATWAIVAVVALIAVGVWVARPITWCDGEGPVLPYERDMETGSGWLGRFVFWMTVLRDLPWWPW